MPESLCEVNVQQRAPFGSCNPPRRGEQSLQVESVVLPKIETNPPQIALANT